MKVLWATNIPVGDAGTLFFGRKTSGLWIDAELEKFEKADDGVELFVVTSGKTKHIQKVVSGRITYFLTPDTITSKYQAGKKKNIAAIQAILQEVQPDMIHIWGTETEFPLDIMKSNSRNVPCVIYIQGVMASIPRYVKAGIPERAILGSYSLFDIIKKSGIYSLQRNYKKRMENEKRLVTYAANIIGENEWCQAYYRSYNSHFRFFRCPLCINPAFAEGHWSQDKAMPHTILCNSSNYSIKGLHMLIKALALVKVRYPDAKLAVPGGNPAFRKGLPAALKRSGYIRYIRKLIRRYGVANSIEFLGYLSPEEMARRLEKVNVFTMVSAIENHSSSLKEAMLLGVPCVSSNVGGVSEYAVHGSNALLYRFEDYEVLADHICRVFSDAAFAADLSKQARQDMVALHITYDTHIRMLEIYHEIMGKA